MFALYIAGIVIGWIGAPLMLWWEIVSIKEMKRQKRMELDVHSNEGGLKGMYKPFVIWIYSLIFFALLLIALFCTVMIAVGSY